MPLFVALVHAAEKDVVVTAEMAMLPLLPAASVPALLAAELECEAEGDGDGDVDDDGKAVGAVETVADGDAEEVLSGDSDEINALSDGIGEGVFPAALLKFDF